MSAQRIYSRLLATGSYLPERVVTNQELESMVDTSDEWITSRTGIQKRHIAAENESTASMAKQAAAKAIEQADIDPNTIDMIIVGSCTNDKVFPSIACYLQQEFGITNHTPAFDIAAACSGFIYSLSIADQYIRTGAAKRILTVGVEQISRVVDWKDRDTCVLFGDGAGAAIFEASEEAGILSTHIHADGAHTESLYADHPLANPTDNYIHMDGNTIFKYAVNHMGEIVADALKANNLEQDQIDWLIPHQANSRIIEAIAKKLHMPMEKVIMTVNKHANTSAASVPLALDCAIRENNIKRGDTILLEAFGAGLTWGSVLLKY